MDSERKQRKDEARKKIIQASFICFGKYGYHQTSLNKIADEAGCSQALTHYHFGSKDDLVTQLIDIYEASWSRLFKEPGQRNLYGVKALDLILDRLEMALRENAPVLKGQIALLLAATDPGNTLVRERFHSYQENTRKEMLLLLTTSVKQQRKTAPKHIDELAKFILCCLRGVASLWVVDENIANVRATLNMLKMLVSRENSPPNLLPGSPTPQAH